MIHALIAASLSTAPAPLEDPHADRESIGGLPWYEWTRVTGDWAGERTQLEEDGLDFGAALTVDFFQVPFGGVDGDEGGRLTLIEMWLGFDLEKLVGIKGGSAYVEFDSTNGDNPSAAVGDLQWTSNIETGRSRDQISEAWYQQQFESLRLKAGKMDANDDFAYGETLLWFMNSSAGYSPTDFTMPTYPETAIGIAAFFDINEQFSISAAIFDGANGVDNVRTGTRGPSTVISDKRSDDYYLIGELGYRWGGDGTASGRAIAGGWYHSGEFTTFAGGMDDGTWGLYAIGEYQLATYDEGGALWLAGQYGYADADVSSAEHHVAAGLVREAPFAGRPDDACGIYASQVFISPERPSPNGDEGVIELFYQYQLTPAIMLQPDLQWVFNPVEDPSADDALYLALRLEVTF